MLRVQLYLVAPLPGAETLAGLLGDNAMLVKQNGFGVRAYPFVEMPASICSLLDPAHHRRGAVYVHERDLRRLHEKRDGAQLIHGCYVRVQ